MARRMLTDKELLGLDATEEMERLKRWMGNKHPMRPYLIPLAIRRVVARAQLEKSRKA